MRQLFARRGRGGRSSGRPTVRIGLAALMAVPLLVSIARAAPGVVGPANPSFEQATNSLPDGWEASVVPLDGGMAGTPIPGTCAGVDGDPQRGICVIDGSDAFTPDGGSEITVQPLDGTKMVRLPGRL